MSDSTSEQFHAARDGKVSEPEREKTPTVEQQKAAKKVAELKSKPTVHPATLKSAESRLEMNVQAEGVISKVSTVEAPKQNTPNKYVSERDGKTYESEQAIEAAKNLDQTAEADTSKQVQKTVTKGHPAPTLTMPGAPAQEHRGKSIQNVQSQQKSEAELSKAEQQQKGLSERAARLAAHETKVLEQKKSKEQEQDKAKNHEIER